MLPLHPVVVALLRPHKAAQAAERLRAGDQWAGTNNLVFMTELGRPAPTRGICCGSWRRRRKTARAVGWLEAGVHIKAVADLLGHSSISITGDVYGHTSDDTARGAVDG